MKHFLMLLVMLVTVVTVLYLATYQTVQAVAAPAANSNNLRCIATNSSNERYLVVYELNYKGRTFLITKGYTNSNYGGTSSSIIEISK